MIEKKQRTYSRHGAWVDWIGYLTLRGLVCLIQCQSMQTCDRVSRILAILLADWIPLRRRVADRNLRLVYGDLSYQELSFLRRRMWHHLLLMVCEIAHTPRKIHRTNWRKHLYVKDKERLMQILMDARPTILVTGHYGNFEVAGYYTGLMGIRSSTIARPLDNPLVDEFLLEFRVGTGQEILPKDGSSQLVSQLLERAGTLCLLADQHAGTKGCWVEFFGHLTSCHKSLALFVLSANAPMVVSYARRLSKPMQFEVGITGIADPAARDLPSPPVYLTSVEEMTRWYNEKLEEAIRLDSAQYWWVHRRWRDIPASVRARLNRRREISTSNG